MELLDMEFHNRTKLRKATGQQDKQEKNADIPYDLVIDLLSRLPVKTLARFKSVSKTWCGFISDPGFVNLHRKRSMKNINLVALSKRGNLSRLNMQRYQSSYLCKFPAESNSGAMIKYFCPLSCDIICFATKNNKICLCSPSKRQIHVLPKTSTSSLFYSKLGFVYSSSTKEYKVVHLFLRRYSDGSITEGMECETFTFGDHRKVSSASWMKSKELCRHRVYSNSVSTDGRIFWLIREHVPRYKLTADDLILSFDSKTEKFKIISRPSTWPSKNYKNFFIELMAVEGNLCIADVPSMMKKSVLDIWMLNENFSWEQLYSINLHNFDSMCKASLCKAKLLRPKYIFQGEILFAQCDGDAEICNCSSAKSYNIEKKTFRNLIRVNHLIPMKHVGVYWESLFDLFE